MTTHPSGSHGSHVRRSPCGDRPLVVGVGGTLRDGSGTERVLRAGLAAAARHGARTALIAGPDLDLPMYTPQAAARDARARRLVEHLTRADGVLIATPAYHGGVSGLVKNALDYAEELREDERPYLDGRAVACIVCAAGWQATTTTLTSLRSIVHALRGWPTPLGVAVNTSEPVFGADGAVTDAGTLGALDVAGEQVVALSGLRPAPSRRRAPRPSGPRLAPARPLPSAASREPS